MNLHVLVVDDDERSLAIFTLFLEYYGCEVIQAHDGREVLEVAKQAQPDLILFDPLLPGIDGFEVVKKLQSILEFDHVPILAVSSLPRLSNVGQALAAGCSEYIEKPSDSLALLDKVKAYLEMINYVSRFVMGVVIEKSYNGS